MMSRTLELAIKAVRSPRIAARRARAEFGTTWERLTRSPKLTSGELERVLKAASIDEIWGRLANAPYATTTERITIPELAAVAPEAYDRVARRAARARNREVDLLGSGPIRLTTPINWHCDFKSGIGWAPQFFRDIEYSDLDRASDVKVPWELSRLQWLIPAAQMYLLTGEEENAAVVRDIIVEWIRGNPVGRSVNWACTMEAAMRVITWTWLFHAMKGSSSWHSASFRREFLEALYLHGRFVARHLEVSPIAGNHYTADATALVFAGLFFAGSDEAERWARTGWNILSSEIERQTYPDGVNHEASVPYHRLVLELFFLAYRYRNAVGLDASDSYLGHLRRMASFTAAYIGPDNGIPFLGDADDARALPLGTQDLNDHRYLPISVGLALGDKALASSFDVASDEVLWMLGPRALCSSGDLRHAAPMSQSFPAGGCYIMRQGPHQVFVDCGPIGLRGRGGHGHNDCLSFEAVIDSTRVVCDSGSFVYTASYRERNYFRSTTCHNTPQIDGQEINRFVADRALWTLIEDAVPAVSKWRVGEDVDVLTGSHSGYLRLDDPVLPERTILLDKRRGWVVLKDSLRGNGSHTIEIPLHLAPGLEVTESGKDWLILGNGSRLFRLVWDGDGWQNEITRSRMSPSYGVAVSRLRILWTHVGTLPCSLLVGLGPEDAHATPIAIPSCRSLLALAEAA